MKVQFSSQDSTGSNFNMLALLLAAAAASGIAELADTLACASYTVKTVG